MPLAYTNNDALRSLSQIFTTSTFEKVVRENDISLTEKRIKKYLPEHKPNSTYKSILKLAYTKLASEYRNEYLYKNNLINEYLLRRYSLKTTRVFTEFKVGNSIADFVLLNGSVRIFEIKTDLDDFDKLQKQLSHYKQFADLVYIVASSKNVSKVLSEYNYSTIGVIEFTENNTFKEKKKAESNIQYFDHSTIFKTLRQPEYLEIVRDEFGSTPLVPNTKIFRACLEMVSKMDVGEFQKIAFNKLKKRKIQCPELFLSDKTPIELKQICYSLDFSADEYKTLYKFLQKTI